jgi:hypothetical protein
MHKAGPLVLQPDSHEVENVIENLKQIRTYKSPGTDQLPAEFLKVRL